MEFQVEFVHRLVELKCFKSAMIRRLFFLRNLVLLEWESPVIVPKLVFVVSEMYAA